jgi:CRISPR-associated protein Csd1
MILQQLYADTDAIMTQTGMGTLPPSGYVQKFLHWVLELNSEGILLQCRSFIQENKKGTPRLLPDSKRTGGIKPLLLADTLAYALGCDHEDNRSLEKHAAFKALVSSCAKATQSPSVLAVEKFLSAWNPSAIPEDFPITEITGAHTMTFRVNFKFPIDEPEVRTFWGGGGEESDEKKSPTNEDMICLLSGRRGPVEDIMPVSVKGIPGGQPAGTHIVSANLNVFESYGLKRGQTSPISLEAGERFGKSLNALLASPRHKKTLGSCTYIFWCREGTPDIPAIEADVSTVNKLLEAIDNGLNWASEDIPGSSKFHLFGLSANAARAVVRSALELTIDELGTRQANWFRRLAIISSSGEMGQYFSLKILAVAAYREFKDIAPWVEDALVQAVFSPRHQLPESLLQALVLRCRLDTDNRVTHPRAALLKYILTQDDDMEKVKQMETEITENNEAIEMPPAYHCGRLFSELEEIQKSAIPGLNAGISEKFFGSASSNPASVFGILLSGAQNHLSKIRKEKEGAYIGAQKRLEAILAEVVEFPKTLSLRDQAMFSLGYYHHRAAKRKEISERSAAKKQNANLTPDLFESANTAEGANK